MRNILIVSGLLAVSLALFLIDRFFSASACGRIAAKIFAIRLGGITGRWGIIVAIGWKVILLFFLLLPTCR